MSDHTSRELTIFAKFAEVCPLGIDVATIVKQEPPNPDILCRLWEGKEIAFEMVEAIDNEIAQMIGDAISIPEELYMAYEQLADEDKKDVNRSVGNAAIGISFNFMASRRDQRRSYSEIFEEFKTVEPDFTGDRKVEPDSPLYGIVDSFNILRYKFSQPMFNLMNATSWAGDPTRSAISKKLAKTYPHDPLPDLLLYYGFQPDIAREDSGAIQSWVKDRLKTSSFGRVWGFDYHSGKILFCIK